MSAQQACAPEDPVMVAWTAYKATDDYANTKRWAKHDEHVDGSLWSAFSQGFADGIAAQGIENLASLMDAAHISEDEMVEAMAIPMAAVTGNANPFFMDPSNEVERLALDVRRQFYLEIAHAAFTAIKPELARLAAENARMRDTLIAADRYKNRWSRCPSTHCLRRQECTSPSECSAKKGAP